MATPLEELTETHSKLTDEIIATPKDNPNKKILRGLRTKLEDQMEEIERVADNLVIIERSRLRHMSATDEFCERVRLWVAEFPFKAPDLNGLPGLLEAQHIDGLTHLTVFDQPEEFGARLKLMGARSVQSMPATLERAVNGFLSRGHASAKRAA